MSGNPAGTAIAAWLKHPRLDRRGAGRTLRRLRTRSRHHQSGWTFDRDARLDIHYRRLWPAPFRQRSRSHRQFRTTQPLLRGGRHAGAGGPGEAGGILGWVRLRRCRAGTLDPTADCRPRGGRTRLAGKPGSVRRFGQGGARGDLGNRSRRSLRLSFGQCGGGGARGKRKPVPRPDRGFDPGYRYL